MKSNKEQPAILPGATIGVLGSGQLGRMFAMQARRMGYRTVTLSPDEDTPTGQIADVEIVAAYDDLERVKEFAQQVDAVTIEFENIPVETLEVVNRFVEVRPGANVLHTTQQRVREKTFLAAKGFPLADFRQIRNAAELADAVEIIGCPCVLKSAGWGYDGKGQRVITVAGAAHKAFVELDASECVLEKFIDLTCELSVVAARGIDDSVEHFGVVQNHHENHVLDYTLAPAKLDARIKRRAIEIATSVLRELDVVGVMCVEMFLTKSGELLVNELAPRPHNSGHWTIDACVTNQFEQQLRAVCGLPLGSTEAMCAAAMVNLLGDVWRDGEPDWQAMLRRVPNIKLHLYGKQEARTGRKMGHLTALAQSSNSQSAFEALQDAQRARELLSS